MWPFKKSAVRPIPADACWGHLVHDHKMDVDTLANVMRCVMKKGVVDDRPVTFLRIFNVQDAEKRMIPVRGWETFDQHPEMVAFEGYVTEDNRAVLEKKF